MKFGLTGKFFRQFHGWGATLGGTGTSFTCVRFTTFEVKCFGANEKGQLGVGDIFDRCLVLASPSTVQGTKATSSLCGVHYFEAFP
eukprot:4281912-Amphidinium_carterae.1